MRISLEWIREYTPLPTDLTPQEIADRLTLATVEVEQVIDLSSTLNGVVLGEITAVEPHPESDRLNLVTVDLGSKQQQVVCGGSNVAVNMRIAFAQSGSVVLGRDGESFTLGKAVIRGIESEGMICAGQELGLAQLLPCSGKEISDLGEWEGTPGQPLAEVLGYQDHILEIDNKSLTNRPDLWGHYGIARELSALYQLPLKELPQFEAPAYQGDLKVEILDAERCGRYTCTTMSGVDARQAPTWMRSRLCRVGQRPINGLVDLTNYVMMATGQPSHAFDARDIQGGIEIRRANEGEKLTLLDATELTLSTEDLVIASSGTPVALAGVMGGELGVRNDTAHLVLEVASFTSTPVRRTARGYGLRTESSSRFEKGIDSQRIESALGLFVALAQDLYPQLNLQSYLDVAPNATKAVKVEVALSFIQRRLGIEISTDEVSMILERLGFTVEVQSNHQLFIDIPSWRATGDVSLPEDIVEEVGRIYGYDRLEFTPPKVTLTSAVIQPRRRLERRIKEHLARHEGLQEVVTYPWVQDRYLDASGTSTIPCLELATPHAPELSKLRPSLIPAVLEVITSNLRWTSEFGIFELGRVYLDQDYTTTEGTSERLPHQPRRLVSALVGSDAVTLFLRLKGILERFARATQSNSLELSRLSSEQEVASWADPQAHLVITSGAKEIGRIGVLSARCKRLAGIKGSEVAIFELEVDALEPHISRENRYQPLPRYPEVEFDLSFIVALDVAWEDVREVILSTSKLIKSVTFGETFMGSQIPEGHKSMMVRLCLGSTESTLSREQIDEVRLATIQRLNDQLNAELR